MGRNRGANRGRGTGRGKGARGSNLTSVTKSNSNTTSRLLRNRGTSGSDRQTRAQESVRNNISVTAEVHQPPRSNGGEIERVGAGEADRLLAGPSGTPSGELHNIGFSGPSAGADTCTVPLVTFTGTMNTSVNGPIITNMSQVNANNSSHNIAWPLHVVQGTSSQHSQSMGVGVQGQGGIGVNNQAFSGSLPFNLNVNNTSSGQSFQSGINYSSGSLANSWANSNQYLGYSMHDRASSSIGPGVAQPSNVGQNTNTVDSTVGSINCIASSGGIPVVDSNMLHMSLPSTPFNPLTSVCSELGESLPQSLKSKIIDSEYVDFATILEKIDPSTRGSLDTKEFSLAVNEGGSIIWKDNKQKRPITSIHTWTSAFLTYAAVYLRAHPHRTQELLKYCQIVRTAATRHMGWGWHTYDCQFRMRQQLTPARSWASIDGELWALYVTAPAVNQALRTNINRNVRFPQSSNFRAQNNASVQKIYAMQTNANSQAGLWRRIISGGLCYDFNSAGCSRSQCKFTHKCNKCNGTGHGAQNCNKGGKS